MEVFELESFDPAIRTTTGELAAKQLINTLDRLEYIDVSTLPNQINENQFICQRAELDLGDQIRNVDFPHKN